MMQFRPFGKSDLQSSVIGFGAWGIGGATPGATSYGHVSQALAIETIQRAIDYGINLFDTSCVYGYGKSETLLGQALQGQREKVIIATKGGMKRYDTPSDFSSSALSSSLTGSLERLKTDYVDVFQLHNPAVDIFDKNPNLGAYFDREINDGRVRQIGISVKSPEEAFELLQKYDFSTVQVNLNMLDTRAIDSGLLDHCQKHEIAVLVRTPLCFGFLTQTINQDTAFAEDDHRAHWSYEQKSLWSEGAQMVHAACEVGLESDLKITAAMQAIRFCFSHPAVSSVLTGPLNPDEVAENAKVGLLPEFDDVTYKKILDINANRSFFYKG